MLGENYLLNCLVVNRHGQLPGNFYTGYNSGLPLSRRRRGSGTVPVMKKNENPADGGTEPDVADPETFSEMTAMDNY